MTDIFKGSKTRHALVSAIGKIDQQIQTMMNISINPRASFEIKM